MSTEVDINIIAENLTELLQNSVNMTSVFYDIFLNPEPMYVDLTQIGANGEVITISIPNRAQDMILASIGTGSPEGVVEAGPGHIYVDSETLTCYVKATGEGNTGWKVILTEQGLYTYIDNYLRTGDFITVTTLGEYLEEHRYTTESDVYSIVADSTIVQYVTVLPSSGSILLDDNRAYRITPTGNITLVPPEVNDLTQTHNIYIQLKLDSTDYTVNLLCSNYFDYVAPDFNEVGTYDIRFEYDLANGVWVAGVTPKGVGLNYSMSQLTDYVSSLRTTVTSIAPIVNSIESIIPEAASAENQLADKNFVNSSIASNTANFIGTFSSVAELEAYSGTLTNNDYAFVTTTDGAGNTTYNRYKYNGDTETWVFEYTLNNSSFTSDQWAAINSEITSVKVTQITTNQNDITTIKGTMSGYGDIVTHSVDEFATAAEGSLAVSALQPNDSNTLLTNDAGYITGINSSDVITALGYTPLPSSNVVSTYDPTGTYPVNGVAVASALLSKQDNLVQGTGITISGNTISATGMTVPIDTVLDTTSVNPVQNKVVAGAINNLQGQINTITATATVQATYDSNTKTIIFTAS